MPPAPLKILAVDDSVIYRKILSDAVTAIKDVQLLGSVSGGVAALKRLEQERADLVLLDVFMPDMNGVETLREIRKRFPGVAVVMVSGATNRDADVTVEALELGALDFIPKPQGSDSAASMRILTEHLQRIVRLVNIRRLTQQISGNAPPKPPTQPLPLQPGIARPVLPSATVPIPVARPLASSRPTRFDIVVIGVSTGGPNALAVVIPALPADLGVPVLIVQHMPPQFTVSLAQHLSKASKIPVREAVDGEPVTPATILLAPGGRHMTVRAGMTGRDLLIGLNDSPPVNSCRPAVDVLFRSVAAAPLTGGVLSVILTGMGEDGAAGVAALKRKSCYSLSQDAASCVVYGMPRAIAERGLSDEVLPLDAVAGRIAAIVKNRAFPK